MILNYCPACAKPLRKLSDTEYGCENKHSFWNNPRATVAIVVLQGDQILVSKRGREPAKGKYDLPGGFLEYGEDVFAAAVREMTEETTLQIAIDALQPLTAYTGFYFENESVCDIVLLATAWSGTPLAQDDSAALAWKPLSFLSSPEFDPPYHDLATIIQKHLAV